MGAGAAGLGLGECPRPVGHLGGELVGASVGAELHEWGSSTAGKACPGRAEPPAGGGERRWQRSPHGPQVLGARGQPGSSPPVRASLPTQRPGRTPGRCPGTHRHAIPTAGFSDRRLGPGLAGQSLLPPEDEQSLCHGLGPPWDGKCTFHESRDSALELHADEQPACPPPGCLAGDARPGERGAGFQRASLCG